MHTVKHHLWVAALFTLAQLLAPGLHSFLLLHSCSTFGGSLNSLQGGRCLLPLRCLLGTRLPSCCLGRLLLLL